MLTILGLKLKKQKNSKVKKYRTEHLRAVIYIKQSSIPIIRIWTEKRGKTEQKKYL